MTATTPSLKIGPYEVDPAVVLAPMAGITNVAFRRLCRQYGAGLYVCEMITTRALVERDAMTMHMITFDPDKYPRSIQLYGVDPKTMAEAVRMIVAEDLADHIDMKLRLPEVNALTTRPDLNLVLDTVAQVVVSASRRGAAVAQEASSAGTRD